MKTSTSNTLTSILALGLLTPFTFAQAPSPLRSIDGSGNNLRNLDWGRAGTALRRLLRTSYADGIGAPAGASRPSARAISNAVCAQSGSIPNARGATSMLWQWGQFIDHDIGVTEAHAPVELFPIVVPRGDPHFDPFGTGAQTIRLSRSHYVLAGRRRARQQVNDITAFLDASMVYGSDAERAAALRAPGGLLATSAGGLLPFNTRGFANAPDADDARYYLAGDIRANEQIGLIAMHTLFVREHNLLARLLVGIGLDAEASYQVARVLVGAEIQAITYREFLPVLLGRDALPRYRGYRDDVDPSIANSFSTAAYRLGHSMLPDELWMLDAQLRELPSGHVPLQSAFFDPKLVRDYGIEPILRGLCEQAAQEIDTKVVDGVRNFLFGPPGAGGFDLASLNIQRGRDHGLPSYNDARRDLGMRPARGFGDITRDRTTQRALASVYDSVEDVDLWVGGLSEDHADGAMVGPLLRRMLVDQFTRLRDGDRFWYERALPAALVDFVRARRLSDIIRDNTRIAPSELRRDAFRRDASRR